jgi:hypothetical protein
MMAQMQQAPSPTKNRGKGSRKGKRQYQIGS